MERCFGLRGWFLVSMLGLTVSGFLTYLHLRPDLQAPMCTLTAQSCETVLNSQFSRIGSVSLASIGCVFYLGLALGSLALAALPFGPRGSSSELPKLASASSFLVFSLRWAARVGALCSLVFVGLQIYLGAFCVFCCLSAFFSLTLALTTRCLKPAEKRSWLFQCLAVGILALALCPFVYPLGVRPRPLPDYTGVAYPTGPASAPVQVVVYSDFDCKYCRNLFNALYPVALSHSHRLSLSYRPFPLPAHANARSAQAAAAAAGLQGKFWQYAEQLYRPGQSLDGLGLKACATRVGLDLPRFEADRHAPERDAEMDQSLQEARQAKVPGAPAVFLNGLQVPGDFSSLATIERLLEKSPP